MELLFFIIFVRYRSNMKKRSQLSLAKKKGCRTQKRYRQSLLKAPERQLKTTITSMFKNRKHISIITPVKSPRTKTFNYNTPSKSPNRKRFRRLFTSDSGMH